MEDLTAIFVDEFRVDLVSRFGNVQGEGWYREGAIASVLVNPIVEHGNMTRRVFLQWVGDITSQALSLSFRVNAPVQLEATWKKQYEVAATSDVGQVSGAGWHDPNSLITLDLTNIPSFGNATRLGLKGWAETTGDRRFFPSSTIIVDTPLILEATLAKEYRLDILATGGIFIQSEWYDADSVVSVQLPNIIESQDLGSRWNLLEYAIDNESPKSIPRRGDSSLEFPILMDLPHQIIATYRLQHSLSLTGGNTPRIEPSPPTSDAWFDAGTIVVVRNDLVWDEVQDSRKILSDIELDGREIVVMEPISQVQIPIIMDTSHQLILFSINQYYLDLESEVAIAGEGWFDDGEVIRITIPRIVERDLGRVNLLEYFINGEIFPLVRSQHEDIEVEIVMGSPHRVETRYVSQFPLLVEGGHDLVIHPSSPTGDSWYDSGAEIVIISSKLWDEIDLDSRTRLRSVTINGEEDLLVGDELKHAISILVEQPFAISFVSTRQFYVAIRTQYSEGVGEGWYDENSEAVIELQDTIVDHSNSTRHVFRGWTGSFDGRDAVARIIVSNVMSITAEWEAEYLISTRMTDNLGISLLAPSSISFGNLEKSFEFSDLDEVWISPGRYSIDSIIWQGIDVSPDDTVFEISSPTELRVTLEVYPAIIQITDSLGFPVSGAHIITQLRNGTTIRSTTGADGTADLGLVPLGIYEGEASYLGQSITFERRDPDSPFREEKFLLGTYSTPIYLIILVAVIGFSIILLRRR